MNLLTNKDFGNDDRIDRLTEKLQKHIDHNARKIERSQQIRNLQWFFIFLIYIFTQIILNTIYFNLLNF